MTNRIIYVLLFTFLLQINVAVAERCFEGSVYNDELDSPLEGVNVILLNSSDNETVVNTIRTDAEGHYGGCFKELGLKHFFVWTPKFSPERRSVEATEADQTIDFELIQSAGIKGTILDTFNQAIEGAHVRLEYVESIDFPFIPELISGFPDSEKDGLYIVGNVEPLRLVRLTVSHPEYQTYISEEFTMQAAEQPILNVTLFSNPAK